MHGEVLHTNDTLICMVKFYIQMILSHLHGEFARLETTPPFHLRKGSGERVIFFNSVIGHAHLCDQKGLPHERACPTRSYNDDMLIKMSVYTISYS